MKRVFMYVLLLVMLPVFLLLLAIFTGEKESLTEAYLLCLAILVVLHIVILLYPKATTLIAISYGVLSSIYLCTVVEGYNWYWFIPLHLLATAVVVVLLTWLQRYIAKRYKAEYYISVGYTMAVLLLAMKIIYF